MRGRLSRPPFLHQLPNGLSASRLQIRIDQLAPRTKEDLEAIDRAYRRAVSAHPQDAAILHNYATFLLSHNLAREARPHCQKALGLAPWDPNAHYQIGLVHAGSDSPAMARKHLQRALEIAPNHHLSHSLTGNLLANTDPDTALGHLQAALRIEPDDLRTLLALANLRLSASKLKLRDPDRAYALARHACEVTGFTNLAAVGMLLEAAKRANRVTEVRTELTTAVKNAPNDAQKAGLQKLLDGRDGG
jgi:tetratricopeptide (TPR) repeat protein